jgi:hypothetical protein
MQTKITYNKIFKIIIILAAMLGIILHTLESKTPMKSFTYFTLQSNILVVIIYLLVMVKGFKSRFITIVFNQAVISIILTGLVFNLLLRPTLGGINYQLDSLSDILIHSLVPALVLIDRFVFSDVLLLKIYEPLYFLAFPFVYWLFSLFYVILGGNFNGENYQSDYPYFFLNFAENGIVYFLLVVIFILMLSYFVYAMDLLKQKTLKKK